MSIISINFIIFILCTLAAYFVFPRTYRWVILLASSLVFYGLNGVGSIIFLFVTSVSIFFAALIMERIHEKSAARLKEAGAALSKDEKTALRDREKSKRKAVLIVTLVLNFGMLAVFKFFPLYETFGLLTPLGISFYTFQSTGYLIDVYWKRSSAEKNYLKELLFISFFPQITQGPISSFDTLGPQLFAPNRFDYSNFVHGAERMLMGFIKKVWLADSLKPFTDQLLANYYDYTGITVLVGTFFYSIWLLADFSGYMDIMCGLCEMLGIKLPENFDHPYFSKSVSEYWRRWHMTLGEWFKKYVYYPVAVSGWNNKLGGFFRRCCGKTVSRNMVATVALLITWGATGIWHGNTAGYLVWGLINGIIIIFSLWMEPVYQKTTKALRLKDDNSVWNFIRIIRTFILVSLVKILPEAGTLGAGFGIWRRIFTEHTIPSGRAELFPGVGVSNTALILVLIYFIIEIMTLRRPLRERFDRLPYAVRIIITAVAFVALVALGIPEEMAEGGFAYARF